MTHFLEVGSMREDLQEILRHAEWLRQLLTMPPEERAAMEQARAQQGDLTTFADDVRTALTGVLQRATELVEFMDQFESDPIIYTGAGSTSEVLAMLERLMSGASHPAR